MRISERSWHLRYVRWCEGVATAFVVYLVGDDLPRTVYVPKNLCEYFWVVVLSGPTTLWLVLCLVVPLLLLKWAFKALWWVIRLAVSPVIAAYDWGTNRHAGRPQEPHDSLVWSYIKAKKRRICPLIEVVEESNQ